MIGRVDRVTLRRFRHHGGVYVCDIEVRHVLWPWADPRCYTLTSSGDGWEWRELLTGKRPDVKTEHRMAEGFAAWCRRAR